MSFLTHSMEKHFMIFRLLLILVYSLKILNFWFAVTGLHDMDEFVQSQLILAVSTLFLSLLSLFALLLGLPS
jgi:hypothetical protein